MAAHPDDLALKNRNRDAGQFFGYTKQLRRYLAHRLPRPQDAEDVAQEVYLRLLDIDQTKLRKPLAFIYGVACHAAIDHLRKARQSRELLREEEDDWLEDTTEATSDDLADRLNLQQQIDRALRQLPRTQALVLIAHKHLGLSYEEVAAKLDISIHTVEKYVTEAKSRMREMAWER
jgi:RNA polymerase sigma-70 factor (ECF subfamily)